jgi:hypothetical protein
LLTFTAFTSINEFIADKGFDHVRVMELTIACVFILPEILAVLTLSLRELSKLFFVLNRIWHNISHYHQPRFIDHTLQLTLSVIIATVMPQDALFG